MEYISAEEFLKQDKEVQKVFLDWWKPSVGDIHVEPRGNLFVVLEGQTDQETWGRLKNKGDIIPLLTEGQIRNFIEDKTGCKNIEILSNIEYGEYEAMLYKAITSGITECEYYNLGTDKLQAYWKVALEIAKESQ